MGRNKDLRKKIAGRLRMIERHEEKIRSELSKPQPDEFLIAHWRSEIEAVKEKVADLTRRLERNWSDMATKTAPSLSTIERLLDEVQEWAGRVQEIRTRLNLLPRGSEAYLDLLPDLDVELDTLGLKTQHALEALEEFEDSLPENE